MGNSKKTSQNLSQAVKIVGIDPALRNTGVVSVDYFDNDIKINYARLIVTESEKIKPKSIDDYKRINFIYTNLKPIIDKHDLIIAEFPIGSQSSRAMVSYAASISMLACFNKPIIPVTPNDIKTYIGIKNASKSDSIEFVRQHYPDFPFILNGNKILNKNEHLADAFIALLAGIKKPEMVRLIEYIFDCFS